MKRIILFVLILMLLLVAGANASGRRPDSKPSSPLSISLLPEESIDLNELRGGETLTITVLCSSLAEGKNLVIELFPRGGVEVVEGKTRWEGDIGKGEEVSFALTVRFTGKGTGIIRARATMREGKSFAYSAHASLRLGPAVVKEKKVPQGEVKRDYRGRDIIEYRQGGNE